MEHVFEQKNRYIRPGPATAITFSTPPHNCLQLAHKHLSIGLCLGSNLCYPHVNILVTCRMRLHTLGVVCLTLLNLNITGVSLGLSLSSDLSWSRSARLSSSECQHTLGVVCLTLFNLDVAGASLSLSSDLCCLRVSIMYGHKSSKCLPLVWWASRSSTSRALALALAAIWAIHMLADISSHSEDASIPLVWCASRSSTSTSRALALALAAI
jgi:hypothetical protein